MLKVSFNKHERFTLKHIYRDKAGFEMSNDEIKSLCRESWKGKRNYLRINRLEDKNKSKHKICIYSCGLYKIVNPQLDPF